MAEWAFLVYGIGNFLALIFRWCGSQYDHYFLVMDLLGPSLEDLFLFCARRFTNKTVLMLADQMLSRVGFIHERCFVHRDIKPDNFLMGIGRHCNKLYIIDYGLAKRYCTWNKGQHIEFRFVFNALITYF